MLFNTWGPSYSFFLVVRSLSIEQAYRRRSSCLRWQWQQRHYSCCAALLGGRQRNAGEKLGRRCRQRGPASSAQGGVQRQDLDRETNFERALNDAFGENAAGHGGPACAQVQRPRRSAAGGRQLPVRVVDNFRMSQ